MIAIIPEPMEVKGDVVVIRYTTRTGGKAVEGEIVNVYRFQAIKNMFVPEIGTSRQ